jgi:hypothetical protein
LFDDAPDRVQSGLSERQLFAKASHETSEINLAEHFPKFGEDPHGKAVGRSRRLCFAEAARIGQAEGLEQTSLALQYPSNLTPSKMLEAQVWWNTISSAMFAVDHIRCRDLHLTAKTALRQPLKFVLFKVFLESADEPIEPGAGVII